MNKEGQNNFCMLKIIISFVSQAYKKSSISVKRCFKFIEKLYSKIYKSC